MSLVVNATQDVGSGEEDGLVVFREQLQLTGLRMRAGVLIVLEVHFLRPAAGKDPKDSAPKTRSWPGRPPRCSRWGGGPLPS